VEIVSLPVGEGSKLIGIPLFKLYEIAGVNVLVCAVEREDGVHIPSGAFTLQEGDTIYVTADIKHLAKLVKNLGMVEKRIRSLLIIGGSRIAFYLARRCLDSGIAVKIIEQNHQRCIERAEAVPEAVIIEADGSRQDVLMAEGLKSYDAVITLTGMDEENLVLSMYAKHTGVPKVITKINRIEYADVFRKVGIGSIISPKGLCCANIVRYVRAMSSASGIDSVLALHSMVDGKVEALEFRVSRETRHTGEALKDIPLRKGMLIACITHEGNTILPRGDSAFVAGDTVIVVTTDERAINDLDDIFAD
jgi:trk system potassium uptake protein TrkA